MSGGESERTAWRLAFLAGSVCVVVAVVARLVIFVIGADGLGTATLQGYLLLGLILALVWSVASWVMTSVPIERHRPRAPAMRRVVRATQILWPIAYVCWILAIASSSGGVELIARTLRFVAGVGAVVLAFLLAAVSDEAELDGPARRLSTAGWLLAPMTLLPQAFPKSMPWFGLVLLGFGLLGWAWVMLLYARGLLDLSRHLSWTQRHSLRRRGRVGRVEETRARLDRGVESSIRVPEPPEPDLPLDP